MFLLFITFNRKSTNRNRSMQIRLVYGTEREEQVMKVIRNAKMIDNQSKMSEKKRLRKKTAERKEVKKKINVKETW